MADTLEKLGKYTLDKRIAVGGMAEVFLATDERGKRCVIKRMLPNLLLDKQFSRMFLDEAKLVVQLNHPSIAQVYDFGQDKGVLYLAMEWVDGTNLRSIVKDFARRGVEIPVEYCARLVSQVGLALGYAHRAAALDGKLLKIIHRDVSPQNILLGQTGAVKLIDFGVAKATSATQKTEAGMIKGKFAYMSPEQLRGNPLDGRSDIFGLGLVLYELLAAERAVPGLNEAEIAQNALHMNFPPIERKRPDIPAPLKAILARALARDRAGRYDTAEEMAAELETFITPRLPKLSGADLAKLLPALPASPSASELPPAKDSSSKPSPIALRAISLSAPTIIDATRDAALRSQAPTIKAVASVPRPDNPTERDVAAVPVAPAVPTLQLWAPAPYQAVARTVINPPGLMARPVAPAGKLFTQSQADLRAALPPSRLKWFFAAAILGFLLAAIGWRLAHPTVDVAPALPLPEAAPPAEAARGSR